MHRGSEQQAVAIVTGAGRGIGRATAEALSGEGYATVLVGRSESALRQTAERLEQPSRVHVADITDAAQCAAVVEATVEQFGRIDVLANVAGFARLTTIDQITPELWRQTIDTNLSAVVHLTAAAWPVFRRQQAGVVVNVSSMASRDPFPGLGAYAAAKIGVNMFTRVTATEGEAIGVRAVCVVPGAVETPMLRSLFSHAQLPAEQALQPADVAELIADCVAGRREVPSGGEVALTA